MALATSDDVEAALGRPLTEDVDFLLEEASDRVVAYLGYTPDPTPPAVGRVVAAMVAAVLTRPTVVEGAEALTAGPYGVRFSANASTRGPWLSSEQQKRLNPFRRMTAITLESETPGWGGS